MKQSPSWTLRSRGTDGTMHDFFEATRFSRKRTFVITNLPAGLYDVFIGIRRDNFFYEQSWDFSSKSSKIDEIPARKPFATSSIEEEDLEEEDEESPEKESRLVRGIRMSVGAAFTGIRAVTHNLTLGKVGSLGVQVQLLLLDQNGKELYHLRDNLLCDEKPHLELQIPMKPSDYCELKIKSLTTIHSVYVYSSLFLIEDKKDPDNQQQLTNPSAIAHLQMEAPTQMLRRALIIGSRHPERLIFGRALAQACMASCCGCLLGFFMHSDASFTIMYIAIIIWFLRVIVYFIVILMDVF